MFSSKRLLWMKTNIIEALSIKEVVVDDCLRVNAQLIQEFLNGRGPPKLFFYYQVQESSSHDDIKDSSYDPTLFISNGENDRLREKAVYFLRTTPKDKPVNFNEANDHELLFGEISPNTIVQLNGVMNEVYTHMISSLDDWEKCDEEQKKEFLAITDKFALELEEALKSLSSSLDICKLDPEVMATITNENDKIAYYEDCFDKWIFAIKQHLEDDNNRKDPPDAGPDTELTYWRSRMQKITSLSEQLKTKDFNTVKTTLQNLRNQETSTKPKTDDKIGKLIHDFNDLDVKITDKLNEAKDNVKFLATLEKFLEPLYHGTPQQIIETLPALMNAIKMIYTIARYYNTHMTTLFVKITNQMITNCKNQIQEGKNSDKIWSRNPEELIQVLRSCIALNHAYQEQYRITKLKVADLPKGRSYDFNEIQIFGKFNLFCGRLNKLIEIFSTIQQFNALSQHNLEGMKELTNNFKQLIEKFRKNNFDLLDYQYTTFDRQFVKFNHEISQLDSQLQTFINSNFNKFRVIEYSLKLLKKFQSILKRDSLKHELSNKYNSVLNNYAIELQAITTTFQEQKSSPPLLRNMPPEANKIIWARHLFQKITGPIQIFPTTSVIQSELRKVYGVYNNLGKQLTVYEMWYFENWKDEIKKATASLQATLIIFDEKPGRFIVNFDRVITQLIREAKCLDRYGIDIPENARIILLQEEKFKNYHDELQYLLREYERITGKIKPINKTLLGPHIQDLILKLRPGMVTLTWTSMNIEAYIHHVHQGLQKLEQLIISVNDIIENRIENNLKAISKVPLVDLSQDHSPLSLEDFVDIQEKHIKGKTDYLMGKNVEVEHAVDDLLQTILLYPLDPHVDPVSSDETKRIKRYYIWYLYQALLNSTQNSLNAMKYRICGRRNTTGQANEQQLKPFFEVDIRLDGNQVKLQPTLDEIQKAINRAATAVLRCSKNLYNWDQEGKDNDKKGSFYEMIAQEKEIVKVILLLTGSIQGTKNKVNEFLGSFNDFEWLWTKSITDSLKEFHKKQPTLRDYEEKLKLFAATEQAIDKIESVHKIGAMALKTEYLKQHQLKGWVAEWKNSLSADLRKKATEKMVELMEHTKVLSGKLAREVKDIDSLGFVMEALEDIRHEQAEIDLKFGPINEMFELLNTYPQPGAPETNDMDERAKLKIDWENLIKQAELKQKELQKKQSSYLKKLKSDVKEFIVNVQEFRKEYDSNGPMVPQITPKEANERLRRFDEEYLIRKRIYKINKKGENLFGLKNQSYPALKKTKSEIKNLKQLYSLYNNVNDEITRWKERAWSDLSYELINEMTDSITKYGDQCLRLPKDLKEWNAYKELKLEIDNFREVLPIIQSLRKPSIQARHWQEVIKITGKQLNYDAETFMFQDVLEAKLLNHKEDIEDICDSAEKQLKIQQSLSEISLYWKDAFFEFGGKGKREYFCLLNGLKVLEIKEKLEEDQMQLATLNAMRHVGPFQKEVQDLQAQLSDVAETLEMWLKAQGLWASLEPVFVGGDIAKSLPVEAKRFSGLDKNWQKVMEKASEIKKVVACCQNDVIKGYLPPIIEGLETCQQALEKYLESKRKLFPRFYFVSPQVLLKILSQGSDPASIKDELSLLFDAISKMQLQKLDKKSQDLFIVDIRSTMADAEETVELNQPVKCEGPIELWLKKLENKMQETLHDIARRANDDCVNIPYKTILEKYIAQISLMATQLLWTSKINDALEKKNEKQFMEAKKKEINEMFQVLRQLCMKDDLNPLDRTKVETLVTIHVHQMEITNKLKCKDVNDFEWQQQTRLYWRQDTCLISITDWDGTYCYEYLGAKERLCITTLTDRCYITLAQAMSMFYGGAPAGPAGTGKTETVKDMGRTLGVYVVVTNCSDQHRYKDMAKIFKGLCQSGLWGCFDEFNRIELEVLSVVAQQVLAISSAKKAHKPKCDDFPGEAQPIDLIPTVGYFITMNPGYAGRQELPENLKVLFRGVTMMVPNRKTIIEVKLASVGYNDYDNLAKKFTILYGLCEEQLSKQRHYDFGLRNILSVLRTAGNTKRQEQTSDEEMLLMRTLRDMNLSKLVADDVPLFNSLLKDIFPKQAEPVKKVYADIERKVSEHINKKFLIPFPDWVLKIIQLYETSLVRHGFMLVGPAGSGKSTIMSILLDALSEVKIQHKIARMNPKAITNKEMYGVKSDVSDDYIPGVFSELWRKSNNKSNKWVQWLVCDGPVDAIWIENLNTVLDDNKILTLASGDRIPMSENCKLVFEVENLNNASPATVSRCGIVYVSATDLGYEPVYKGWILQRKQVSRGEETDKLLQIFNKYLNQMKVIENIEKICKAPVIDIAPVIKVCGMLNLINGLMLQPQFQNRTFSDADYEKIVLWAMSWALGGIFESKDRVEFHEFLSSKNAPLPPKGKENETIFEYCLDADSRGSNIEWKLIVPEEWRPPEKFQFSQLLLPTLDSTRAEFLIKLIADNPKTSMCSKSSLLVGGSGTAKTSTVLMFASKFKKGMLFKRVNFSSATQPSQFQDSIENECDVKMGVDFVPPGGNLMTVFIDDMSMPLVNEWGDQVTLEIVRQLVETNGFYWLDKSRRGEFKFVQRLQYIGAMNHPGGGRNDIPNRLKRHFFTFNMIPPNNVDSIFGSIIKHQFKPKFFTNEFNKVAEGLTNATLKIWNKIKTALLPTPNKFHYVFNLRDLSRIFKGVLQIRRDVIQTSSKVGNLKPEIFLITLWRHECERVFVDKLIAQKEKDFAYNIIQDVSIESFSQHESEISEKITKEKPIFFCDFLREDIINEDGIVEVPGERVYEAIQDIEKLRNRAQELLGFYNMQNPARKMDLVLFDDALKHLLRISRILAMPRSSALLVGIGGSGKQSLTRLAANIERQILKQIKLTKNFSEKDLKEELKILCDLAGHQAKPVAFIMTDAEVKNENFLEYINMLLSTGEIPGLIQKDEKEAWLGDLRTRYVKERGLTNYEPPNAEVYQYFMDILRDNLHIVLCFSPVGPKFRERARKFPALFNECTIDWFLPWPEEALVSVADEFIQKFKELDTKQEVRIELPKHMGSVHLMVNTVCDIYFQKMRRQVYVTPKSFLSFIRSYRTFYIGKYQELDVQEKSFKVGLQKIQDAAIDIQKMSVELKAEEVLVRESQEKTEALLRELEKENKKASAKEAEVEANATQCLKKKEEILAEKEAAQKDLAAAKPALERATRAVQEIKQPQITEIKQMKTPQEVLKYVVDCVAIIFGVKVMSVGLKTEVFDKKKNVQLTFLQDSWIETNKSIINDFDFLKKVTDPYLPETVNEETIELLEPYFSMKEEFINEENGVRASQAVGSLLRFVYAVAEYYEKSKIVKPKMEYLAIQQAKLEQAELELGKARAELAEVKKITEELRLKSQKQMEEKNALEDRSRKTKNRINQAKKLIDSLTDEKERWTKGKEEITEQKRRLVGNVSMACAFISYCGPFNAEFRSLLVNEYFVGDMKKKQIPVTPGMDLTSFLVDDATISEWNLQGLPKDELSIQNGILVTNSSRFPLLIDPQGQGQAWIKNKYAESMDPLRGTTTLNNPRFKEWYLRPAMEDGKALIIEGIENEVDPLLDPVLERQVTVKSKKQFVDVGGEIEWHPAFKMFLTCRLPNPLFSPELSAKTTIIDFTVTQSGLEQQLLGRVLSKESKALEDSLQQLLTDVAKNKKDLQNLDKSLLEKLTNSKGNLLEDAELVDVLATTKNQAREVQIKLADAEVKTKEINEKREQYRSISIRGSVLYFCIIEMSLVNWMYNSSLSQFLGLFDASIDNAEKATLASKRVDNILKELTYRVYRYVNRGLFEKDKVTFILMICFKIMVTDGKIGANDISYFLKSGAALDLRTEKQKPVQWLQDKVWLNILALSRHQFAGEHVPFFKDLPESVTKSDAWKIWIDKNDPENFPIPDFEERITQDKELGSFIKLCLVRSLREDRTLVASTAFINSKLDTRFTSPVTDKIEDIWFESSPLVPVLYLLSAGADPTSTIDEFSRKKRKAQCKIVSMGEGQEEQAREYIKQSNATTGQWVILQNCHLALKYMEEIDANLSGENAASYHPDFRLFITCEPHLKFPLSLLQKGIKVTNEPPKGLKKGLYKTFTTIVNQDFLDKIDHPNWRSLVYTVCFLHSVVQERRKFGSLGWCIPYEFNNSDLEASLNYIEKYLNNFVGNTPNMSMSNLPISFHVINYMVCEVQYGGRITDDLDRELFNTYGSDWLKEAIFGDFTFAEIGGDPKDKTIDPSMRFKYKIPNPQGSSEIKKYIDWIEAFPSVDSPEVFGLHPNADLTFRIKESSEMINTIMETRPKDSSSGGGKTREEMVQDKARELLSKLPADYIENDVKEQIKKLPGPRGSQEKGMQLPLHVFLSQEIQRMQRVISLVRKTFVDLIDAIDGIIILTPFLLDAMNAIYDARVPGKWLKDPSGAEISWLLPTLGSWFNSLIERNTQLATWLKQGRPVPPQPFWLTGFFNPQGFLTAMKQEVTRMHKGVKQGPKQEEAWSLDDVDYFTQVKEREPEMIKDIQQEGVYIHGLYLEGCRWNRNNLDEPEPKKMFAPLPILYVTAINNKKKPDADKMSSQYRCPVYKYPSRTDRYLIFRVPLNCEGTGPNHWKLRGVALLCSIE